ncbi:unnamed protein product, partial [Prunus brigantina]
MNYWMLASAQSALENKVRLNGVKCWAKMMKGQSHLQFPISLPQHVSLPNLDS